MLRRLICRFRGLGVLSRSFALICLASIAGEYSANSQETAPTEIIETFTGGNFDRMRWTLSNIGVQVAKVDFSKGAMRVVVPPTTIKQPLMGLESRFGLEGDFDISVDYSIRSLPRPAEEWVNLSIFIQGPPGMAAMTRTNHSKSGDGYSIWFQPSKESKAKGTVSTVPTSDRAGTLRLARVGKELFYYASSRGQPLKQIGTVDFGDQPIDLVGFHVLPPVLKTPIDFEYDNISVKADRFTKLVFIPPSSNASWFWVLSGLAVILLILLWWWKTRRAA
jgi:hypothetical protein